MAVSYTHLINLSAYDKYLLTASVRADGSSKFKKGNRWSYFPSFSLAWRMEHEEFLNRLNQIITEHLDNEQLGIPFICNKIGISRASLYNKLKALTDMGANDYITKIRMERAIWLILHTELSVNDIADKTGFSTARYFSTVFKQHTGCSPTQYREKPPVNTQ